MSRDIHDCSQCLGVEAREAATAHKSLSLPQQWIIQSNRATVLRKRNAVLTSEVKIFSFPKYHAALVHALEFHRNNHLAC